MTQMSTRQFLDALTLDQLLYAKELADEIIKSRREKGYTGIYSVLSNSVPSKHFVKDDYLEAVRFMYGTGLRLAAEDLKNPCDREIRIQYHKVPADEVSDWVSDN